MVSSASFIAPGWRCEPSAARPQLVDVITAAVGCIGIVEQPAGSNRGPWIDEVLRRAGLQPGMAWCAASVSDWYSRMDKPAMPRRGSAYKIYEWAKANGLLVDLDGELLPGDILGVFRKDDPTTPAREDFHGHVGLYVGDLGVDDKGVKRWATVEANVRSACRGLVRTRSEWAWAARPLADPVADHPPAAPAERATTWATGT